MRTPNYVNGVKKFCLYLVKPSNYDDQGFPQYYLRGVLPSNTLACLYGLSQELVEQGFFGDTAVEIKTIDEIAQKIPWAKIERQQQTEGTKVLVCLVGVQSNQWPRAMDLAQRLRKLEVMVVIGGFHITGVWAMFGSERRWLTRKYLESIGAGKLSLLDAHQRCLEQLRDFWLLQNQGVSLVAGEIEEPRTDNFTPAWSKILRDALSGQLLPLYDFLARRPNIETVAVPKVTAKMQSCYALRNFGTIDCGRGCPFGCTFCTIINVQGRQMRCRSAQTVLDAVRRNWRNGRVNSYFFTDDNFARNKNWQAIFVGLKELREKEGLDINFMMQVDTLAYQIPDFLPLASQAGCSQVFIGLESVNPKNIAAVGKGQNQKSDIAAMVQEYHRSGIAVHVGYIIGFPYDTVESVRADLQKIMDLQIDQVSFFILTPLPGSEDHRQMILRGEWMDPDLNKRDSFHPVTKHQNLTAEAWLNLYWEGWKTFYQPANFQKVLLRWQNNPKIYWNLFSIYIWYTNSLLVDATHPMIGGFWKKRSLVERRPGQSPLTLKAFRQLGRQERRRVLRIWWKQGWVYLELWLATHNPDWDPWWVKLALDKFWQLRRGSEKLKQRQIRSRQALTEKWLSLAEKWHQGRFLHPDIWFWPIWNGVRELVIFLVGLWSFLRSRQKDARR